MGSVCNGPTEVGLVIPGEFAVYKRPRRLVPDSTPIAGDANHIICLEPFDYTIGKKIVVNPDIVMNENEQVMAVRCRNACIENVRKTTLVCES